MVAYNKFQGWVGHLGLKLVNLNTDLIKVMLVNSPAPTATDDVIADLTEITGENGYTAGGDDTQNTFSETTGTGTVTVVDVVWNAAGNIGPFRYVVAFDDTVSSPVKVLVAWWDHGSSLTLVNGESFTVDFASNALFTLV